MVFICWRTGRRARAQGSFSAGFFLYRRGEGQKTSNACTPTSRPNGGMLVFPCTALPRGKRTRNENGADVPSPSDFAEISTTLAAMDQAKKGF
jgi:hypothetical protein